MEFKTSTKRSYQSVEWRCEFFNKKFTQRIELFIRRLTWADQMAADLGSNVTEEKKRTYQAEDVCYEKLWLLVAEPDFLVEQDKLLENLEQERGEFNSFDSVLMRHRGRECDPDRLQAEIEIIVES